MAAEDAQKRRRSVAAGPEAAKIFELPGVVQQPAELARPPALGKQRRGTNKARVKKKEAKYYKSSVAPAALSPHSAKCNSISETPSRRSSFPSSRLQVR